MNKILVFLEKKFKTQNDKMGIPSIILINGVEKSLIHSIDRKKIVTEMKIFLMDYLVLTEDVAKTISTNYLENKYKEYRNYVLNL